MKTSEDFIPAWVKTIVWYQIFPDRFRNGDPRNDPTLGSLAGSYPHDTVSPWQVHPWTSDWYALQPYERQNGKSLWFNIQRRRYGGDLQGIIDRLDYLADLGIGGIYLNPIFESPSSHKYDQKTYHHVDPHFGPDPEGDRKLVLEEIPDDPSTWKWTAADRLLVTLIEKLHERGMRIILDGVFNHMSPTSWPFQDVVRNQQRSKYKDWFKIKHWNDPATGKGFDYAGWNGFRELPELAQDENGIVEGPKRYIFSAVKRWMDPEWTGDVRKGVDGWRLDVAFFIRHGFWKDFRPFVKSINPEAYILGEVILPPAETRSYLEGDELDGVTNYNFVFACSEFFINEKTRITAGAFDRLLRQLREAFPPCAMYGMANLVGCHDTDRIASRIVNRDRISMRDFDSYWHRYSKASNPEYQTRKPFAEEQRAIKLLAIFQMTYPGSPMIYYGDEAGIWGANDPCTRKPMVWPDLRYNDAAALPDGSTAKMPDKVAFDHDLFNHYKTLIAIRNTYDVFHFGDVETLLADDRSPIYAFKRKYAGKQAIVVLNNGKSDQQVTIPVAADTEYTDVLNGGMVRSMPGGRLTITLKGLWGSVLIKR